MNVMWVPRVLLAAVLVPHALGKVTATDAFLNKFEFMTVELTVLIVVAELTGAAGVLAGGLLPRPFGAWCTRLAVAAIAVVQVGAVVIHWPQFFYWSSGFEYNLVLLGLCLMLALRPNGRGERKRGVSDDRNR